MGRVIIESAMRPGGRVRVEPFEGTVSIGRAYDNDLILLDRSVSPHHLRVREIHPEEIEPGPADSAPHTREGVFEVEDLGSENGVRLGRRTVRGDSVLVTSGEELIIGRTRLRLFTPDHPVRETESLNSVGLLFEPSRTLLAWATVALSVAAIGLLAFSSSDGYDTGTTVLVATLGAATITVGWAAAWALVGRVLGHRAAFSSHAAVISTALAGAAVGSELTGWLSFVLPRIWIEPLCSTAAVFVVAAAAVTASLRLATHLRGVSRLVAGCAVASLVAAGVLFFLVMPLIDTAYPVYPAQLRPVPAALLSTESVDEFLTESEGVFRP